MSADRLHARPALRGYGRERLDLPPRVVDRILASNYAALVAGRKSARRALFPQIVSLHTRRDLGQIDGLGAVSIRKIEIWLVQHGTRLREPCESIDEVICNFRPRKRVRLGALVRGNDVPRLDAAE